MSLSIIKHACGILWTITYLLAIYKGHKDRTYGVPLIAVAMNIAWEVYDPIFSAAPIMGHYGLIWLTLDIVLAYQALQNANPFRITLTAVGIGGWFAVLYVSNQMGMRVFTSAFFQNAIMSLLFIHLITSRKNLSGQSVTIALFKLAATAVVSLPIMASGKLSAANQLLYYPQYMLILTADICYLLCCIHYSKAPAHAASDATNDQRTQL